MKTNPKKEPQCLREKLDHIKALQRCSLAVESYHSGGPAKQMIEAYRDMIAAHKRFVKCVEVSRKVTM